jgi:hypothetical protein
MWTIPGCTRPTPPETIPAGLYHPILRDSLVPPSEALAALLEEISNAADIPVLRSVTLPPGARELRLTGAVSGMIWRPIPQLRLVEWTGGVMGQLYFYWYRLRDSLGGYITPGWVKQNRSWCNVVRQTSSWATCRIRLRDGITWQAVADSMEALKVWDLPPENVEDRIGSHISDQEGILGERLIGIDYRRFRYYDLERLSGGDVPRISAAARLVENLVPHDR